MRLGRIESAEIEIGLWNKKKIRQQKFMRDVDDAEDCRIEYGTIGTKIR